MVVADKYKLARQNGKFDKGFKQIIRKGMKVLTNYVDEINFSTQEHGIMFIIDEEATEQMKAQQVQNAKMRDAKTKIEKSSKDELIDALKAVTEPKKEVEPTKTGPGAEPTNEPLNFDAMNKKELMEYLTSKNIEFKEAFSLAKLVDLAKGGDNA